MNAPTDPPIPPVMPEADVRTPKDGDDAVQQNAPDEALDGPLESLGKAISAPVIESADPTANEPAHKP